MMTATLSRSDLEELLICAVRYCLPRHTYVVADADRWVRTLWPDLTSNTRRIVENDVARALASDSPHHLMDMDRKVWRALHAFMTQNSGAVEEPTTQEAGVDGGQLSIPVKHAGTEFEYAGPCKNGCDEVGYLNESGYWMGSYVRVGTRVLYLPTSRVGVIAEHDDAWNNRVEFERRTNLHRPESGPIWTRAPAFARADGSPLRAEDHTTVRGAGR